LLSLLAARHPLASPECQLAALDATGVPTFEATLSRHGLAPLVTAEIEVLQVNVGRLCNQTCAHCHVDAGPDRRESMSRETAESVVELLRRHPIPKLDITGGAPELNPSFRFLVEEGRALGRHVMDRCNLTVLTIAGQSDLPGFLAAHRVEVIASLPSARASGTDAQRGEGVFEKSLTGLRKLNAVGYGKGTGLVLNLVHNPVGAFLSGGQTSLERDYKRELLTRHGIVFDRLYTITNMPISRFLEFLERSGNLEQYMDVLIRAFNPAAVSSLMCRTHISVGWDGVIYDCDFNQMLDLKVGSGAPRTLTDLLEARSLDRRIVTARHCFGCTAGAGSSCGGALSDGTA
jgi:radical SAM/Cys-rich protein